MSEEGRFKIELEQLDGYEFKVKFDWDQADDILMDEPPPLGQRQGPNASRLLAAAAANCLSASLLFCLNKTDVPAKSLRTEASCILVRNEKKRLRIGGMEVKLHLNDQLQTTARLSRCLTLFEDFCVVTASLRQGIPVTVEVLDADGQVVHRND